MSTKVKSLLKLPYGRCVMPDTDGTFRAEIIEFPGCIATGKTAAEALESIEEVASEWLTVVVEKGQKVPEPIEKGSFSGKLVVRLPRTLHKKAAHAAARDGVSLNQYIVSCIAEHVGAGSGAQRKSSWSFASKWHQIANVAVFVNKMPSQGLQSSAPLMQPWQAEQSAPLISYLPSRESHA